MTIPTKTLQGSNKFKRLKKASRDNQQERSGFFAGEEVGRGGDRGGKSAEEKLKHSLFGDDEGLFFFCHCFYFSIMYFIAFPNL